MLRIRTILGPEAPLASQRIAAAQQILRENFPGWEHDADRMQQWLRDPVKSGWRASLLVAETRLGRVNGFALVLHFARIGYSFLDYIAVRKGIRGRGLGGALYEAVREHCLATGAHGLFLEAESDVPRLAEDERILEQNRKRLRFYEYYGVFPVANTEYHLPLGKDPSSAFLLYDSLGRPVRLALSDARRAVRLILDTRFADLTTPTYIRRVVRSFRDDPVQFRPPVYVKRRTPRPPKAGRLEKAYALVVNHKHVIHHVQDRGYEERPARVGALMEAMERTGLFTAVRPKRFTESHIAAVHDRAYVRFLKQLCRTLVAGTPVYADTFPRRQPSRVPRRPHPDLAGFYCLDSFTPLDDGAYRAARAAVDAALTGAEEVLTGVPLAYALCRPPGHHAERALYGGFCYFNNAAIAAQFFSSQGRTAILDLDFHHGNGTQDIFYQRGDVLTVSLHGHPERAYPYFAGYADETGDGDGRGCNLNIPLPEGTENPAYLAALKRAVNRMRRFRPAYLVVSLGFDTLRGDPTGFFSLTPAALQEAGRLLAALRYPTLVVQEGGYNLRNLRQGAAAFFRGWVEGTIN